MTYEELLTVVDDETRMKLEELHALRPQLPVASLIRALRISVEETQDEQT